MELLKGSWTCLGVVRTGREPFRSPHISSSMIDILFQDGSFSVTGSPIDLPHTCERIKHSHLLVPNLIRLVAEIAA